MCSKKKKMSLLQIPLFLETLQNSGLGEAENALNSFTTLQFSFQGALLGFALLVIVSTIFDKIGAKLSIPGSIFLFSLGLISNFSGFSFESMPLEQVHIVALCILLFFSGLTFDQSVLKDNKLFVSSILLALLGTVVSMVFWVFYVRYGLNFFALLGYAEGIEPKMLTMMTVIIVYSMAVHDWNSYAFVHKQARTIRKILSNVFKIETSISAAISLLLAEVMVLAWLRVYPEYSQLPAIQQLGEVLRGVFIGIVSGIVLGLLLTYVIRNFVDDKPQLVLVAMGFTFLGYFISDVCVEHGGYLCALIMGITTSSMYRSKATLDEIQFLGEELESFNIASEAILFYAIGLGLQPKLFFYHLPIAIFIWIGIMLIRPVCVKLFVRSENLNLEELSLLSFWSPKGAISMALVVGAPELLHQTFEIEIVDILPLNGFSLMVDSVCGAVIISMIVKSFIIPKIHPYFAPKNSSNQSIFKPS